MKIGFRRLLVGMAGLSFLLSSCQNKPVTSVTVPVTLDHNRMLVEAEIQKADGAWRSVRLWIDTGNPNLFVHPELARELGVDVDAALKAEGSDGQSLDAAPNLAVRIGGMDIDFSGIRSQVIVQPSWLFSTMHNDANLPSSVLMRYQVVFDYPNRTLTLATPGSLGHRGTRAQAAVHPETGIVQLDAVIGCDSLSLALDNGASYSFLSDDRVERLTAQNPEWPRMTGAVGCANIWGWWPGEAFWTLVRVPKMTWGSVSLEEVVLVGLPSFTPGGPKIDSWYSRKTAYPVAGLLGPNAFKAFRVEIDYQEGAVYLEKGGDFDSHDLDLVGLTLRPLEDGSYQVLGIAQKDGAPAVQGVEPGDVLIQVDELTCQGATMGTVVDALRDRPGKVKRLVLERNGERVIVEAQVIHLL